MLVMRIFRYVKGLTHTGYVSIKRYVIQSINSSLNLSLVCFCSIIHCKYLWLPKLCIIIEVDFCIKTYNYKEKRAFFKYATSLTMINLQEDSLTQLCLVWSSLDNLENKAKVCYAKPRTTRKFFSAMIK